MVGGDRDVWTLPVWDVVYAEAYLIGHKLWLVGPEPRLIESESNQIGSGPCTQIAQTPLKWAFPYTNACDRKGGCVHTALRPSEQSLAPFLGVC